MFVKLALKGGGEHPVTVEQMMDLASRFPRVDIPDNLRRMERWCQRNLEKRKPRDKIEGFIDGWLGRAQRSREEPRQPSQPDRPNQSPQQIDQYLAGLRKAAAGGSG